MYKVLMLCTVAALAMIVASLVHSHQALWRERSRNAALELELAEAEAQSGELRRLEMITRRQTESERRELVRLRAEVTQLRQELEEAKAEASAKQLVQTSSTRSGHGGPAQAEKALAEAEPEFAIDRVFKNLKRELRPEDEPIRLQIIEKERQIRVWWQAFLDFAEANEGHLPASFADAAPFLPPGFQNTLDLQNFTKQDRRGRGSKLAAIERPSRNVLTREISPLALSDGLVCKIYLMADGSIMLFQE